MINKRFSLIMIAALCTVRLYGGFGPADFDDEPYTPYNSFNQQPISQKAQTIINDAFKFMDSYIAGGPLNIAEATSRMNEAFDRLSARIGASNSYIQLAKDAVSYSMIYWGERSPNNMNAWLPKIVDAAKIILTAPVKFSIQVGATAVGATAGGIAGAVNGASIAVRKPMKTIQIRYDDIYNNEERSSNNVVDSLAKASELIVSTMYTSLAGVVEGTLLVPYKAALGTYIGARIGHDVAKEKITGKYALQQDGTTESKLDVDDIHSVELDGNLYKISDVNGKTRFIAVSQIPSDQQDLFKAIAEDTFENQSALIKLFSLLRKGLSNTNAFKLTEEYNKFLNDQYSNSTEEVDKHLKDIVFKINNDRHLRFNPSSIAYMLENEMQTARAKNVNTENVTQASNVASEASSASSVEIDEADSLFHDAQEGPRDQFAIEGVRSVSPQQQSSADNRLQLGNGVEEPSNLSGGSFELVSAGSLSPSIHQYRAQAPASHDFLPEASDPNARILFAGARSVQQQKNFVPKFSSNDAIAVYLKTQAQQAAQAAKNAELAKEAEAQIR